METFCNHWDSRCCDKWIPHVKHAKDLFTKEVQSEDQLEAIIIQDDKDFQVDEYDDPELLIEEDEE